MKDIADLTGSVLATYGPLGLVVLAILAAFFLAAWFFVKLQAGLNEREKNHNDAVQATFQMYQAQLEEYRQALERANQRIATLEAEVKKLEGMLASKMGDSSFLDIDGKSSPKDDQ